MDYFEGTCEPDPTLEAEYFQPPVATTAEAAAAVPDTDSESGAEFCLEHSDAESEQGSHSEQEHNEFDNSFQEETALD